MFKTKLEVDRHVDNSLKKINNETEKNLRCFSFAKLYLAIGAYEQASRYVSLYLSVKPKSAEGHHLLGKALEKLGKKEAALEAYRKSLQLDSKQNNLVIKVCELLASDDVDMDKDGARYFCDLAQSIDPHNSVVFSLKERLLTSENNNPSDVSKLLLNELETRPTDINLRIRLLKHFLQYNKIKEAYKHASDIENKDLSIFHNCITWYETFAEVLVRYQRDLEQSLTWEFWFLSVSVLERLVALSLDDHIENVKGSSEYLTFLFNFDQILSKASQNIASCPDRQLGLVFINHFHAQLYFHIATCLFKQAKKDFLQFKDVCNITLPVLLAAYHCQPPDLQSMWLNNCPEQRRSLVARWQKQGSFRCSQTGHILLAAMKDRKSLVLDKASQYSTGIWREQLYKKLFVKRDQQQKINKSFFVNSPNLLEPVFKMPDITELLQFDENAQLVYPDSLHNYIWIAINTADLSRVVLKSFDGLPYSVKNLNSCAAESLSILDIQAFIYCATISAQSKLEQSKNLIFYNSDKPNVLPAIITEDLGTINQSKFLTAAYKMYKNDNSFNTGEIRLLLIKGIEVVRCVGQHGLDVKLLVKLATIFEARSKQSSKQSEIDFNNARAELYWKAALPMLEKLKNNQILTYPSNRLFEYKSKEYNIYEISGCIEKGKLFTGVQLMKKKEYEKALHIFEMLKDPYASYYQSEIFKHMADQKTNQNKENVTSEMRSQNIILLSKARDCLYLTLDRLREPCIDRSHPLNSQLGSEIERIERLLSRIDPDCTNRNECDGMSDENGSSDSAGEHYLTTYNTSHQTSFTPKHDTQNNHSTPYKLESNRREARPSPERLDAQLRQLAASKDLAVNNILEQNRIMVESHKSLLEELRSFKDAVNNLTATVEDLKSIRHGLDELKQVKNSVQELKHSVDDLQSVVDIVRELKKEIGELKKDSTKAAQLSEEDLYVLDTDYGVDYGLNANLGQFNPTLYQNYQGRLSTSGGLPTGTLPPSYGPPAIYPGLYPAMAAAYAYGGAVLPQPGAIPFVQEQQITGYPTPQPALTQQGAPVSSTSLGIGLLTGQGLSQSLPQTCPLVRDVPKVTLSTFTSTTQAVFPSMSPITTKSIVTTPSSRAPPVNVVITSSDPLPTNTTPVSQPPLSVIIPPQHIKGNIPPKSQPHNYQIVLPSSAISTVTATPSILTKPPPVVSTQSLLSNVAPPVFSAVSPTKSSSMNVSLGIQIEKSLDKSFSPNSSLNKTNKSHTSFEEHDPCPDFKPIIPLPDEVPVNTGEENENILFSEKAKLFRYVNKEWKERGVGNIKILEHKENGKIRILMRRDQVHKICANHLITKDMSLSPMTNNERAYIWVAHDFAEGEVTVEKFCVKFKTVEDTNKFYNAFEDAKKKLKVNDSKGVISTPKSSLNVVTNPTTTIQGGFTFGANKPQEELQKTSQVANNSLGGFTFSSAPSFKPKEIPPVTSSTAVVVTTKSSPFSNFSFVDAKTNVNSNLFGNSNFKPVSNVLSNTFSPVIVSSASVISPASPQKPIDSDERVEEFEPTVEFKPVVALPELVDVKTGEEDAEVLFECKAKLFKLCTVDNNKEWKERGVGNIKILKEDRIRLVMRREQVHKVCLNHQVLKDMVFNIHSTNPKAVIWSAKDFSEGILSPETFTARFKTEEQASEFLKTLQSAQASLSDQNVISSKHHKAESPKATTGFGDKFKLAKGTWTCKNCYINNDAKTNHCVACETPKNDTIPKKTEDSEKSGPTFSFGIPSKDTSDTAQTSAKTFTFGGTPTSQSTAAKVKEISNKGFGDAFKPKADSWECKSCFVNNNGDAKYCIACEGPKDDTIPKKENKSVNLETNQKFSFGIPSVKQDSKVEIVPPKNDGVQTQNTDKSVNLETKFSFGIPTTSSFSFGDSKNTEFSFGKNSFGFSLSDKGNTQDQKPSPVSKFTFAPAMVDKVDDKNSVEDKFIFGSSAEHQFEFTPRSPSRRISSGQGDEESDGSYIEEEDTTYFKPVIPMPEKVEVKTGEEDEDILYCQRSKLFRFVNGEWKERGLGDVKILKGKTNGKLRVVMRREHVMKICLNHILTKDVEYRAKDDKTWLFHAADFSEGEILHEQFCLRFKSAQIAEAFKTAVDKALNSKSDVSSNVASTDKETESDNDVIIVDDPISPEEITEAKRLGLPYTFFQYRKKTDCECSQCKKDDEYLKGTEFSIIKSGAPLATVKPENVSLSNTTQKTPLQQVASVKPSNTPLSPSIFSKTTTSSIFPSFTQNSEAPLATAKLEDATKSLSNTTQKTPLQPQVTSIKQSITPLSATLFGKTTSSSIFPSFVQNSETNTTPSNDSSLKSLLSTPSTLGKPSGNLFSTPTSTSNIFGSKSIFGGSSNTTPTFSTASATPIFGATPNASGSIFGSQNSTGSFSTNIFGSVTTASTFPGMSSSNNSLFGNTFTNSSSNIFQTAPVNLTTAVGKPSVTDTTKLKDTDEVVLKCKSDISFATLAAETSGNAAPAFSVKKDDSIKPFSFAGAGAPVFGGSTLKKLDQNKSANTTQGEEETEEADKEDDHQPTEEEYDPHYEPIIPMPEAIVVSTGEENEQIIFNERSKLYRYNAETKEWKERGVGQFKILFHPENNTYRLILRRDQVHKVVLNQLVQSDLDIQPMITSDKAWMWAGHNFTDDGHQVEKLALRFKTVELAQKFKEAIDLTICKVIEINNRKLSQIPTTVTNYDDTKHEEYIQETEEDYDDDEDDDEDDIDEEEDFRSPLFESTPAKIEFSYLNDDANWECLGTGMVGIYYYNELCATRITVVTDDGECLSSSIIGLNTVMDINDKECIWEAIERIDENNPAKKSLKIVFDNEKSALDFYAAYLDGVRYAQEVGIEDNADID